MSEHSLHQLLDKQGPWPHYGAVDSPFRIFRDFRALISAVQRLAAVLEQDVKAQEDIGPALVRLETLELERHKFEAEMEGLVLKADGKLKAAANAEARERQLKKSYERQLDDFDPTGEEGSEHDPVLPVHAPPSDPDRVSALHLGVAPSNKTAAVRAKFGL